MLIDTHAHLNQSDYDNDLEYVIARALKNDVQKIIVVGMDEKSNQKSIEIAEKFDNVKATIGIHPCYYQNEDPKKLEKYLKHSQVIAIGETGLDLHHRKDNLLEQKNIFKIHIELALKYKLPLILHARDAFLEVYEMLQPYKEKITGVFHCLVSNLKESKKALELGFYIGIGGIVTYKQSIITHEIAKTIPLEKIILETDCPYLTPIPFNKQRNEPANIKIIAEKIAKLRNISLQEVSKQTTKNVKKLFNF
ncbi:MAG: TatD family hydrolase [Candidatus Phytoplasma pyri]|uniref:TatD family hydrolase n=1 Tax=Candidatus Phytoplasma pyri TaxID=47566 RepID=UPI003982FC32